MRQQILIGGVGGQGVLFVTGLLAEAAVRKGFHVLTTETHGMAQRGGTVVSHLKVGTFSSPMIRPLQANGLLALTPESAAQLEAYVRPDGWIAANQRGPERMGGSLRIFSLDANRLAQEIRDPRSVNLVLLGFAVSRTSEMQSASQRVFCSIEDLRAVLEERLAGRGKMLQASLLALEAGYAGA